MHRYFTDIQSLILLSPINSALGLTKQGCLEYNVMSSVFDFCLQRRYLKNGYCIMANLQHIDAVEWVPKTAFTSKNIILQPLNIFYFKQTFKTPTVNTGKRGNKGKNSSACVLRLATEQNHYI